MKGKILAGKADRYILGIALILIAVGLVAVSSASAVVSFQRFGHNNYYFFRQLLFAGLGLVAMYVFSRLDYHLWRKYARFLLVAGIILLATVMIPGVGLKRWFRIGSFFLQPSEFMKLAVIFYLAAWFERKKGAETNFWFGIVPPLLAVGAAVGLVVAEPDIGTAVVFGVIILLMLFAAGARLQYLGGLLISAAAALWLLIKAAPYREARIATFLDPNLDQQGIGYHINQALLAIGSGGWWGYGFGASRQKHNYLPEPIGDSIFAVMAEELGFFRVLLVVLLFAALAIKGLQLAKRAPDKFGQLTAIGIIGWISMQALINIGAITGLLPLTGIPLPFLSYGGSSLLALSAAIGVLLNISKQRL